MRKIILTAAIMAPMSLLFIFYFLHKEYKSARAKKRADGEWLDAKKQRSDFLACHHADHPIAQELIEFEIAAYKRWIKAHPENTEDINYLAGLRKMSKRRRHLRSVP